MALSLPETLSLFKPGNLPRRKHTLIITRLGNPPPRQYCEMCIAIYSWVPRSTSQLRPDLEKSFIRAVLWSLGWWITTRENQIPILKMPFLVFTESFPHKRKRRPTHDSTHYGECSTHTLKHQDLKTLAPKTSWTHSHSFDLKPKGMNFWSKVSLQSTKQLWVLWRREWLSSILVWMSLK